MIPLLVSATLLASPWLKMLPGMGIFWKKEECFEYDADDADDAGKHEQKREQISDEYG